MKRLLIASDYAPSELKAASVRLRYIISAFIESHFQVTLISPGSLEPESQISKHITLGSSVKRGGIFQRIFLELKKVVKLPYYIQKLNPDLIFISSPPFSFAAIISLIAKKNNIPLLVDIRDVYPLALAESGILKESHPLFKILKKVERFIYNQAEIISVVTREMKEDLKSEYPEFEAKFYFLPNGAESIANAPIGNKGLDHGIRLFMHGTLGRFQDSMLLLNVAEWFKSREKKVLIQLNISDGKEKLNLIEEIQERRLEDCFNIEGLLPMSELNSKLSTCHLGLSFRNRDRLSMMAYPVKIFDYCSAGIPVIITPVSPFGSEVHQTGAGYVFDNDEVESICNAIENTVLNKSVYNKMAEAAIHFASRYYRPVLAQKYVEMVHSKVLA
ncbi:glycosyltransferase family 4 protein [Salinispira pacifica]|uniref:Uncharacterized protein n=1 Tax=Salinispira pacifica TaxID=1307761 RepID=V5WLI6_9SPIO|nr:glycosyltransferase family 4 protein [Salinispira pacifica]AHC16479.1 hypothetical protein L21SP2_3137 [Salinispira pacifica]